MSLRPDALPGPRAFLQRVAQGLARNGSLVLHLPRTPPSWLLPAIEDAVGEETGVRAIRMDAGALRGRSPAHAIAAHVMPGATRIRSVDALLAEAEMADAAILVCGIAAGKEWEEWTTFRRAFDRVRGRLSAPLKPFLLLCAPPGPPPRTEDGTSWIGCTTRLDAETAAAARLGSPAPGDLVGAAELAVAVEVAAWDISLLDAIATIDPAERMDPAALCLRLRALRPETGRTWSEGGVDLWDGEPLEHATVAAARDDGEAIVERVLHGQLRVVFPFLDRVRRRAIARDRHRLAAMLPFTRPWGEKRTVNEAERLEIGDILHLATRLTPEDKAFLQLCRDVRNDLAHGKAATRREIVALNAGWHRLATSYATAAPRLD